MIFTQQLKFIATQKPISVPYVRQCSTMLIEPSINLSALLRDFYIAGGRVVVKEFRVVRRLRDCVSR